VVFLLPLIAVLLLVVGGGGCALLLLPRREPVNPTELAVLAVILGSALVAATTFIGGFVLGGYPLLLVVGLACLGTAALGARFGARIRHSLAPLKCWWLPTLVFASELGLLVWLGGRYILGWDSLVVWEFKARAAMLNGGGMPLAYYVDVGTQWSHPEYPLLLPLTEAWLFDWAGRADERLVRGLFALYDAALLAGMYVLGTRLGGSRWKGALSMLMVLLVPQLIIGTGGTTTAWADYLVALLYLMAAGYLVQAVVCQTPDLFRLVGALSAALVWTKQEGALLWLCLVLATAVFARGNRVRATALVMFPALAVIAGWRLFLQALNVPPSSDFLPINLSTFLDHFDRIPELIAWTARQMADGRTWGLLWAALALSVFLSDRCTMRQQHLLALLAVGPLVPDVMIFVFSAWTPYTLHVESALPRLMEQVAPLAVLAIAIASPRLQLPSSIAMAWGFPRKAG
jgi:hypothetical protein